MEKLTPQKKQYIKDLKVFMNKGGFWLIKCFFNPKKGDYEIYFVKEKDGEIFTLLDFTDQYKSNGELKQKLLVVSNKKNPRADYNIKWGDYAFFENNYIVKLKKLVEKFDKIDKLPKPVPLGLTLTINYNK